MPQVDNPTASPFPKVRTVMNQSRALVNDTMDSIAGELLADDAPATETYLNAAWRWLQGRASTAGIETYTREAVLNGVPARYSDDVALQSHLNWTEAGDGSNSFDSPVLPSDLINPLSLWRRASNGTMQVFQDGTYGYVANTYGLASNFQGMTVAGNGLPRWMDCGVYDWREDGLYFYGERFLQDFLLRYSAYRADLVINQPDSPVSMMMCEDVMSSRIAYEFALARGAPQAEQMEARAEKALAVMEERTSRRKQRGTYRRKAYGEWSAARGWPVIR